MRETRIWAAEKQSVRQSDGATQVQQEGKKRGVGDIGKNRNEIGPRRGSS